MLNLRDHVLVVVLLLLLLLGLMLLWLMLMLVKPNLFFHRCGVVAHWK